MDNSNSEFNARYFGEATKDLTLLDVTILPFIRDVLIGVTSKLC